MYLIVDVMVHPDHQKQGIDACCWNGSMDSAGDLASGSHVLMVNLMATPGNEGFTKNSDMYGVLMKKMGSGMMRWINR